MTDQARTATFAEVAGAFQSACEAEGYRLTSVGLLGPIRDGKVVYEEAVRLVVCDEMNGMPFGHPFIGIRWSVNYWHRDENGEEHDRVIGGEDTFAEAIDRAVKEGAS